MFVWLFFFFQENEHIAIIKDTMLRHFGHEIIIVEEEKANHCDDEESGASSLKDRWVQLQSLFLLNFAFFK